MEVLMFAMHGNENARRRAVREAVEAARARANAVRSPEPFATLELDEDELNIVIIALDVLNADSMRRARKFQSDRVDEAADKHFDRALEAQLLGTRARGLGPKRTTQYGRLGAWES
jgi:hypothetical protein